MVMTRKEQLSVLRAYWTSYTYTATSGTTSTVLPGGFVTTSITETSGGNASSTPPIRGIITTGSGGFVRMRAAASGLNIDDSGSQVFGRLSFAAGNYTISYKKLSGSSEIVATLPGSGSYSIEILFPEVMRFGEVPADVDILYGTGSNLNSTGSVSGDLNVTGNTTLGDAGTDTITLNGRLASNFLPSSDNTRSLGNSTLRLANVNSTSYTARGDATDTLKATFSSSGIAVLAGPFSIDVNNALNLGTISATSLTIGRTGVTTTVAGDLVVSGTISFVSLGVSGNTTLGDSTSDNIIFNGRINSDIIPKTDNVFQVGTSALKFVEGHFSNVFAEDFDGYSAIYFGASQATDLQFGNSNATITINSPVTLSGTAGESISNGELISLNNSGGNTRVFKAESDGYGVNSFVIGVAGNSASIGQEVKIIVLGEKSIPDSEWDVVPAQSSVGQPVYLSKTAGNWTITAPSTSLSFVQKCGILSRGGTGVVKVIVQIGDSFIN